MSETNKGVIRDAGYSLRGSLKVIPLSPPSPAIALATAGLALWILSTYYNMSFNTFFNTLILHTGQFSFRFLTHLNVYKSILC
jgi:hypothetical protein